MEGDLANNQLKQHSREMAMELEIIRNSEKIAQESLQVYRQIVENANSVIIRLSPEGIIEYVNPFAGEILGRQSSGLTGKNIAAVNPPISAELTEKIQKMMHDLLVRNLKVSENETHFAVSGDKKIWISWISKLLADEQGNPKSIISIGTDITRRKYAEEALRESEFNLTKAQEIAGVGSWAWEIDTDNFHGSAYFFRIFGIHPSTSYKHLLHDLSGIIHHEYRDFIQKKIQRAILKGSTESYTYQITHPDGQHRWILEEVSLLGDVDQKKQVLIGTIRDITDQKKTEDKLREYLLIVSSSSELMSLINTDYQYVNVNQSYLDAYNKKASEIEGKTVAEVFGQDIFDSIIKPNIDRCLLGENVSDQYWFDFAVSGRRFMDAKYNPVREMDGTISGITVSARDITDLKKAEEQLRIFKLFTEESGIGLGMAGLDGRITYVNSTLSKMAGFKSPSDVIGRTISETYLNGHYNKLMHEILPVVKEKGQWTGEIDMIRQDGEVIHTIENFFLIKNQQDEIVSYAISVTDITDRKHAEEALQKSESNFRLIFSNAAVGIDVVDENGNFLQVNDALARMMGYTADELKQIKIQDITHPDDREKSRKPLKQLFDRENESYRLEKRYIKKDGSVFWADLSVSPYYDVTNKRMLAIGTINDISKAKTLQEELQRSREEAIEANRAKSEFLANMSHEIRTPLNAVIGFTELLESLVCERKQMSYLESIKSGGKNLLLLINDILDLSKIEAGKLEFRYEPINPYSLINEIKQIFALKIEEKKIDFIIDVDDEIPQSLILDEVRLRQVIFNLIGNAIKFTQHGYVRFSVKKLPAHNDSSKIDLLVSVEDTGIGIPADQHERIFDAFQQQSGQSTRKYGGTGLGLSISKRLVEMMKGEITLKSKPGKGSIFEFRLKDVEIGTGLDCANGSDDFDYSQIVFEPALIMIVDDIELNRLLIIENFSTKTMHVIEAEDGEKAVALALQHKPDLIFMDIRMPVMNGFEAARIIKTTSETSKIPIVALTASVRREDQDKDYAQYFDGYLRKPVSRSELYREMSVFLKHSQIVKPLQKEELSQEKPKGKKSRKLTNDERSELIQLYDGILLTLWKEAIEFQMSDGIETFAGSVKNTGEKFKITELIKFGDDLLNYVDNFDLNKMEESLKEFPKLITKLKVLLRKD
jgi:PAS domain S-box-containing protein